MEIRLDPGWKTYWRQPGDSGVPPTFDFGGSENVNAVKILWPAPERFPDGAGGNSIGYVGRVVLPLRIAPKDATKPSSVHLKLGYAICGNLCVPAEANLELGLTGDGAEEAAIEKADLRVPRQVALGAGQELAIRSVHREPGGEHDRVTVEVAAPKDAPVELFVEGPTSEWSLPLPEPSGTAGDLRRFTFDLDGHAARRAGPGRHADLHRRLERRRHRGSGASRLIRPARYFRDVGRASVRTKFEFQTSR